VASRRPTALAERDILERFDRDAAGIRALERGDNVITIFDVIGEDFWTGGVTAKDIGRQLKAIGGPVEVQINSPGGDVFEGFAIYNVLREHPYSVDVKVLGMAASAASVVAMAGDNIMVGSSAFVMIHNCWVLAVGNRHDMRETADFLEPFDKALRDVYVARTGNTDAQVGAWMDAETYFSGKEAVDKGFADALLPSDQIVEDAPAQARDRETNAVRAMELTLLASGLSRTQARERIQKVKAAKPGAGAELEDDSGTPGAADDNRIWSEEARRFLAELRSNARS
jgi:ATP-dependent protease ClpP protease subunit